MFDSICPAILNLQAKPRTVKRVRLVRNKVAKKEKDPKSRLTTAKRYRTPGIHFHPAAAVAETVAEAKEADPAKVAESANMSSMN